MGEEEDTNSKLSGVWRTCNKIRTSIFRIGINIWDFFNPLDPNKNMLISESKFINVVANKLNGIVGISNQEIEELADYFRVQDGRIYYAQFCEIIQPTETNKNIHQDLVTGLEWEDPLQVNRISASENRRLCVLLTKIAQTVRLREFVLRPYFQDYELISKNNGTITIAHFSRIFHCLGILLSPDDYQLLLKRFMKDSYTVNYIAFIEEIEKIVQYLDTHRMIDRSNDIIENFPGRLLDAQLPKLPRPEIDHIRISDVFGKESSFHPVLKKQKEIKAVEEIILRIQKHIQDNQIRIHEFFQDFDSLRSGFITKSQFLRGLDLIGISGLHRLFLSDVELKDLCFIYRDELDPTRVEWTRFKNDIDKVFAITKLDKNPLEIVKIPPSGVKDLNKLGNEKWQLQQDGMRDLCEESIFKVKSKIVKRRLFLEPLFKNFDRHNNSHVSRPQMRQVLLTNGILLSDEELYAIERRYNDDIGFNYVWFLNEADSKEYAIPKFEEFFENMTEINAPKKKRHPTNEEKDIVQIIARVKGQVVRKRIRIIDFVRDFDKHNELCICEADFRRGLNSANIILSEQEVDLLCNVFKSPLRKGWIDYKRFCQIIEEAFYQPCLERAPLIIPLQHFPSDDCQINFLNFEERTVVSKALQKLARAPDNVSNLISIFTDYDRVNCGTISKNLFLRAITVRDLHNIISSNEFDIICKGFSIERGLRMEIDYRRFLQTLDMLYATKQQYPF